MVHRPLRIMISAAIGLLACVVHAQAGPPQRLTDGVSGAAERAVAFITAQGYGTVGVLKFRVRKPGGAANETVGTFNRDLATQLETALVVKRKQPANFLLVTAASDTAAAIPGAGDATEQARDKLFSGRYRPAWGAAADAVAVDAFVTGVVDVDEGLETMKVTLAAIDRTAAEPREIASFEAAVEPALLAPLGESFTTRGMLNAAMPVVPRKEKPAGQPAPSPIQQVSLEAAQVRDGTKPHPLADPASPVTLAVTYDGVEAPLEFRDGRAFVAEPAAGQKVRIVVRKRTADGRRLGVVLKVNGENTAMRERAPDVLCYKWILSDATPAVAVDGYQVDQERIQPFVVLAADQSQQREFSYGADVGTISVTVFDDEASLAPGGPAPGPATPDPDPPTIALLERGARIDSVALQATPQQLRERLLDGDASTSRGLVVAADTTQTSGLQLEEFRPVPVPALVGVITYYDRAKSVPAPQAP